MIDGNHSSAPEIPQPIKQVYILRRHGVLIKYQVQNALLIVDGNLDKAK
jgi:hypothetical protein